MKKRQAAQILIDSFLPGGKARITKKPHQLQVICRNNSRVMWTERLFSMRKVLEDASRMALDQTSLVELAMQDRVLFINVMFYFGSWEKAQKACGFQRCHICQDMADDCQLVCEHCEEDTVHNCECPLRICGICREKPVNEEEIDALMGCFIPEEPQRNPSQK